MVNGMRWVDCDMHIIEPEDLFDRYLEPAFKHRITTLKDSEGNPFSSGFLRFFWLIDGKPISREQTRGYYRKISTPPAARPQRIIDKYRFASERGFDPESQLMAMEMEGIDLAVLFPTAGLYLMARNDLEPRFALAICQAYNNWLCDFAQYSPAQFRWVAMLPPQDVNLACQELVRCVNKGAVGSFFNPNPPGEQYWNSNYWEPLYYLHEEMDVAWCFHSSVGAWNASDVENRYGPQQMCRHIVGHWVEAQLAITSQIAGGVFEAHPDLRVGYLEAQAAWAPGLLSRMQWDFGTFRKDDAPYLSLKPKEYFQRNCWISVEGGEPEILPTVQLLGADHLCISTDYPHPDSEFPEVSKELVEHVPADIAAKIFRGAMGLFNLDDEDMKKAEEAAVKRTRKREEKIVVR